MTDAVEIVLISSLASISIGLWNGYVILKTHSQSKANGKGLEVLMEQTNGIQDKLMKAEKQISHEEGMAAQREQDKTKP